jgi:hypothetical protein
MNDWLGGINRLVTEVINMIFESVIKSLLLITQLTEFLGPHHLCFLVEDKDEFVDKNFQLLKDLPINYAKFASCYE